MFRCFLVLEIRGVYTKPALKQRRAEILGNVLCSHHENLLLCGNACFFICLHHNTAQLCRQEISCKVLKLLYPHLFQSLIGKKILPLPPLPAPDRTVKPAAVRTKARSAETPNAAARFSLVRSPFPSAAFETGCPCLSARGKRTARFRLRRGPCGARFLPAHFAARVPWSRRCSCSTPPSHADEGRDHLPASLPQTDRRGCYNEEK